MEKGPSTTSTNVRSKNWKQNFLWGFSLANLCLYDQWSILNLHSSTPINKYLYASPFPMTYVAMLLNLLLLSALFTGLFALSRSSSNRLRKASGFLLTIAVLMGFDSLRRQLRLLTANELFSLSYYVELMGKPLLVVVGFVLCVGFCYVFFFQFKKMFVTLGVLLGLLFPVGAFHAGWTVYHLATDDFGPNRSLSPIAKPAEDPRVLWMIFDMAEQRYMFDERPKSLKLPEFDRFRDQAFYATDAYSPAVRTLYSLSAYTTGKRVLHVAPVSGNDIRLTLEQDSTPRLFSEMENIFKKSRELNFRTALIGWTHPYCQIFRGHLDFCYYHSSNDTTLAHPTNDLLREMKYHLQRVALRKEEVHPVVDSHLQMFKHARKMVVDDQIGLGFIHWTLPHDPWIYNRQTKQLELDDQNPRSLEGYLANLELADQTLGTIRRDMEKKGLWDRTTVIISSDHYWWHGSPIEDPVLQVPRRPDTYRIPFMVKMAGQTTPRAYPHKLNTLLSHDLVLDVLQGRLSNAEQVATWVDKHRREIPPILKTDISGLPTPPT